MHIPGNYCCIYVSILIYRGMNANACMVSEACMYVCVCMCMCVFVYYNYVCMYMYVGMYACTTYTCHVYRPMYWSEMDAELYM